MERLGAWLEDALPAKERASVAAHLSQCDDCRRTLTLSGAALATPPESVDPSSVDRWMRNVRRPYAGIWSYVAAAGVLVAVAVLLLVRFRPSTPDNVVRHEPPAPPVKEVKEVKKDTPEPKREEEKPKLVKRTPPRGAKPEEHVQTVRHLDPPKPKHEMTARNDRPTKTDLSGLYEPLALVDGTGDLWIDSARVEGSARAGYGQVLESRNSPAAFTLEGSATVALEPKSRAWVARLKRERAYALALETGLAFVDTEGTSQPWQFLAGTAGVLLPKVQGRLFVTAIENGIEIHVLQGKIELSDRAVVETGHCMTVDAGGKADVRAGDATAIKGRLMRLRDIRPACRTAFLATFDEGRASSPFAYSVEGGQVQPSTTNAFLRVSPIDGPENSKGPSRKSGLGLKLARPVQYFSGMMVRFKFRAYSGPVTIRLGPFTRTGQLKETKGQWKLAEFPVELFESEGVQIVSGEKIDQIWISADRVATLEVDDVELVRSAQFAK